MHPIQFLPQTQRDVFVVPLHVLWVVSVLLPQYSSRAPQRHFPWFAPALVSQRGSQAGQSEFCLHAEHFGNFGSIVVSHFGVLEPGVSHASLRPQIQNPAGPGLKHLSAPSELQMPSFGGSSPVLH